LMFESGGKVCMMMRNNMVVRRWVFSHAGMSGVMVS
jgi:hypothetical protein